MEGVRRTEVTVVGAGISGLYAAKLLHDKGVDVIVLEANDRVGGRILTIRNPSYNYVDMGGTYIGSSQRRMVNLLRELGLQTMSAQYSGKNIFCTKEGKRYIYDGIAPDTWDANRFARKLEEISSQIPLERPWEAKDAKLWDSMTMKEFIDKTCWTSVGRSFAYTLVNTLSCVEPEEVSVLYFMWGLRVGGGLEEEAGAADNTAQGYKIIGGCQQVCDRMSELLAGKLILKNPVVRISENSTGITVTAANGLIVKCKHVICAMTPTVWNRITFEPALSPMKQQLIQRVPMGAIIKTMTFYPKAYWKDLGYSGETTCHDGPICFSMPDYQEDGTHPAIMGIVCADKARMMLVTQQYAKIFQSDKFLKPLNYIDKNWMEEQYIGGGYGILMPPGVFIKYARYLYEPHGHVLFAGTDCATSYASYMEGGLQAAERAVEQILLSQENDKPNLTSIDEHSMPNKSKL